MAQKQQLDLYEVEHLLRMTSWTAWGCPGCYGDEDPLPILKDGELKELESKIGKILLLIR